MNTISTNNDANPLSNIVPGDRVRLVQQVAKIKTPWTAAPVEGTVQRIGQAKTGSWFAHAKDDKLWLDRLELVKDDGEIIVCNLDQYSRIEKLS